MRTVGFTKRLVIVAVVAAVALFVCDFTGRSDAQEEFSTFKGRIVKVMGNVSIRRAGEKEWIDARHGMELGIEDQIMTGIESSADIIFLRNGQRSKVRILEDADMSLMTLNLDKVTGDSEILLDLAIGHIIIKTDPLKGKSKFEVLTPTSMTAVRGTGFEVKVIKKESPIADGGIIR